MILCRGAETFVKPPLPENLERSGRFREREGKQARKSRRCVWCSDTAAATSNHHPTINNEKKNKCLELKKSASFPCGVCVVRLRVGVSSMSLDHPVSVHHNRLKQHCDALGRHPPLPCLHHRIVDLQLGGRQHTTVLCVQPTHGNLQRPPSAVVEDIQVG